MSITTIRTFCGGGRFLFWCKIFRYMIEKEQKAKRVYHRTKPASKKKNRKLPLDCIRTELRSFSFSSVIKFFTNCLVESFLYSAPSASAAHYVYSINFTEK